VPVPALLVPNLQRLTSDAVQDGQEAALFDARKSGGWVSDGVRRGKISSDPRRTGRSGLAAAKARPAASREWGVRALKETGTNLERVFCAREARGSGQAGKGGRE
jgi:hypothetical protein